MINCLLIFPTVTKIFFIIASPKMAYKLELVIIIHWNNLFTDFINS